MNPFIAEAREWVGTPYIHQAHCKGGGTDCLGLIRGVWRAVLGPEPEEIPAYTQDWSEPSGDETILQAAERWLVRKPLDDAAPADVLLFRMRDGCVAKHLGLQAEGQSFIHAYTGHGVIESPLSNPWMRRIAARFRFPERN